MGHIPRWPIEAPGDPPARSREAMPVPRRRSIFGQVIRGIGWLASSPVHWLGVATIRRGGTFIGDLAERLRPRPRRDPRFRTTERGVFDLGATAWSLGVSVVELRHRLDARRRQTAVAAYLLAGLGVAFFLGWLLQVLHTPMTHGRMLLAFDFLPLCLLFVLLAFHQALVNFQIRVGRTAGWREYLTADDGFWPRM